VLLCCLKFEESTRFAFTKYIVKRNSKVLLTILRTDKKWF